MATQIRFRRGTTAQHSTFTGAAGEVTVDTDKKTVVVHDGVTPGGQPLATTANNIPSDNSVSTVKIQDGAVTTPKIADLNVTEGKLASAVATKINNTLTNSLTAKTTPVDADEVRIADSAASFAFKKLTFANLKTWVQSFVGINLATSVATTSGTSVDFTGIPSNAKRVTLNLYGTSTNGTSDMVVQVGTSSGVEASGYAGTVSRVGTAAVASVGATGANFATIANNLAATSAYFGKVVFEKVSGNLWTITGVISTGNDNQTNTAVFAKTTAAALDRVRLTTAGGANTFDAGTASISWEI